MGDEEEGDGFEEDSALSGYGLDPRPDVGLFCGSIVLHGLAIRVIPLNGTIIICILVTVCISLN